MKTIVLLSLFVTLAASGCVCVKQEKPATVELKVNAEANVKNITDAKECQIVETAKQADGAVKITWRSEKGGKYEVLSTTSTDVAKAEWKVEATVEGAEGETTSWTDTKAAGSPAKLYKIRKVEPPK
jgi:hypothetical protein